MDGLRPTASRARGVRQETARGSIGNPWGVGMAGSAGRLRDPWPPRGTFGLTTSRSGFGPASGSRPWGAAGASPAGSWRTTGGSSHGWDAPVRHSDRPWGSATTRPGQRPSRRPPRRSGPGIGVLLLIAAAVFGGVVWRSASGDIAFPPAITETPVPTAMASASGLPGGEPPDDGLPAWSPSPLPSANGSDHLEEQTAAIYAAGFPAVDGCPDSGVPTDERQMVEISTKQVRCLEEAWAPTLAALGIDVGSVRVYSAEDGDMGPCGEFTDAAGDYCTAGGGIIRMSVELLDDSRPYLVKDVVNHEFGHRLQHLTGLLAQESMTGLRRVELQAECLGWGQAARDSAMSLDEKLLD